MNWLKESLNNFSKIIFIMGFVVLFSINVSAQIEDRVLFVNLFDNSYFQYHLDGEKVYQTLVTAGADVTNVLLSSTSAGQVASLIQANEYDQVWVFDLSQGADDYPTDWQAIADWFNADPSRAIICDARMISSYWSGRWTDEGQRLTENYYENMKLSGGGILLGTDDYRFYGGINTINDLIDIELFSGFFVDLPKIPVDTANPLMNTPNDMGVELQDDSSPGQTPHGIQPNGRILHAVAWHSGNTATPGISATIEGGIFNVHIDSPEPGSTFIFGNSATFIASSTNGDPPITHTWSSNLDGLLGTGDTITVSTLSAGIHQITVLAEDVLGRADDDTIEIEITPCTDSDDDGWCDTSDNCPTMPNGPDGGTCTAGDTFKIARPCDSDTDCGDDGFCSMNQEDADDDGKGDACDLCEGDFQCDLDVDGLDASTFKQDFGRSKLKDPCTNDSLCQGDFDCDHDTDGSDASRFKADFGRGSLNDQCPPCQVGIWCVYP